MQRKIATFGGASDSPVKMAAPPALFLSLCESVSISKTQSSAASLQLTKITDWQMLAVRLGWEQRICRVSPFTTWLTCSKSGFFSHNSHTIRGVGDKAK